MDTIIAMSTFFLSLLQLYQHIRIDLSPSLVLLVHHKFSTECKVERKILLWNWNENSENSRWNEENLCRIHIFFLLLRSRLCKKMKADAKNKVGRERWAWWPLEMIFIFFHENVIGSENGKREMWEKIGKSQKNSHLENYSLIFTF